MEQVQTRSEVSHIKYFDTIGEAFDKVKRDNTVWEISFQFNGERVRLVRGLGGWHYEPIMESVKKELASGQASTL